MSKNYFIPRDDAGKDLWLKNFANKLPSFALKYGINATETADMTASSLHFSYWLNHRQQYEDYVRKITTFKNESRDGIAATAAIPTTTPVLPSIAGMPAAAAPGIFPRAASIAARIKNHKDYIASDGHDLGIIGTESTIDLLHIKPQLALRLVAGGHPEIVWHKNHMDAIEIYVDRGANAGYSLLAFQTQPNTIDAAPLPTTGQAVLWKYKAIYRLHDEHVGLWSDEVSIMVSANL